MARPKIYIVLCRELERVTKTTEEAKLNEVVDKTNAHPLPETERRLLGRN